MTSLVALLKIAHGGFMKSDYHFKKFRDEDFDTARAVRKRARRERNQARKVKAELFRDCDAKLPDRGR